MTNPRTVLTREMADKVCSGDIHAVQAWNTALIMIGDNHGLWKPWAEKANEVCRLVYQGQQHYWPTEYVRFFSIEQAVIHVRSMNWSHR